MDDRFYCLTRTVLFEYVKTWNPGLTFGISVREWFDQLANEENQ